MLNVCMLQQVESDSQGEIGKHIVRIFYNHLFENETQFETHRL